jgi:methylase of polypeptide subunit release factors
VRSVFRIGWCDGLFVACDWEAVDPVEGEQFDLVTANPPFVISPNLAFVFRDGGGQGDGVSRQVVAGTAGSLRPGGWATVLCNWSQPVGERWHAPVERWLSGSGCNAWVLRYRTDDPVTYAAIWNHTGRAAR